MKTHAIKRLTLVTDAWLPQINGVVTTLTQLVTQLRRQRIDVDVIHPYDYPTIGLPTYPEIPVVWRAKGLEKRLLTFKPQAIHIATEGALGWRVRRLALKHHLPFTTAYHTKYPEYLAERLPIPSSWIYKLLCHFHAPATRTLTPSHAVLQELSAQGFNHLTWISRGVDQQVFNPSQRTDLPYPRPVLLYVGRIAVEKNLEAFLQIDLPGTKLLVGDGPLKTELQNSYPQAIFVGARKGIELAQYYASADVMVFPSLTDTFGLVNIEAMACGTPVAAFPVTGPIEIIIPGLNGALNPNLKSAVQEALLLNKQGIAESVRDYDWQKVAHSFLENLAIIPKEAYPN